ncbi:hypothetical protein ACFX2A_022498 [Malus domestica]
MQIDPAKGWMPTLIGYSAQGACKFGFYRQGRRMVSDECWGGEEEAAGRYRRRTAIRSSQGLCVTTLTPSRPTPHTASTVTTRRRHVGSVYVVSQPPIQISRRHTFGYYICSPLND